MATYLNQVLLTHPPPQKMGVRNLREIQTLQLAMDCLLNGDLGMVGDVLMQRFKAIEGSMVDGGWELSRHMELIPSATVSTTTPEERERAGRLAVREAKLSATLQELRKKLKVKQGGARNAEDESHGR